MKNNWIYIGIFLNEDSKELLLNKTKQFIPNLDNWVIYCHHMTLAFNNKTDSSEQLFNIYQPYFNDTQTLIVTDIGISDDAIAVRVKYNGPTQNEIPHITIATPINGKPVNSNYIKNWYPLDNEIFIHGIIKPFLKTIK